MTSRNGTSTPPAQQEAPVVLARIAAETLLVPIVGTAPLIVHRFGEKAKRQMLDKMQGRATVKERRDPEADYQAAFYRFPGYPEDDRSGVPVISFKAATIGAARYYKALKMTELKQYVFFTGELGADGQQLAVIEGEARMREDVVRVSNGGTDLRYRPEYPHWWATLQVTYVASVITRDSVLSLIDAGGLGVGVGEWRIEKKNGWAGTYRIDESREVEVR